jgi:hypothetical protein
MAAATRTALAGRPGIARRPSTLAVAAERVRGRACRSATIATLGVVLEIGTPPGATLLTHRAGLSLRTGTGTRVASGTRLTATRGASAGASAARVRSPSRSRTGRARRSAGRASRSRAGRTSRSSARGSARPGAGRTSGSCPRGSCCSASRSAGTASVVLVVVACRDERARGDENPDEGCTSFALPRRPTRTEFHRRHAFHERSLSS